MPKLQNFSRLQKKLADLRRDNKENEKEAAIVGYSQRYAIIVHEDLTARHKEGKTAKYLEGPARRLQGELAAIIRNVWIKTRSLRKGLLVAGLRLQRESQEIVPIDTSALKASAYTALEKDADKAATEAFNRSEAIRLAAEGGKSR